MKNLDGFYSRIGSNHIQRILVNFKFSLVELYFYKNVDPHNRSTSNRDHFLDSTFDLLHFHKHMQKIRKVKDFHGISSASIEFCLFPKIFNVPDLLNFATIVASYNDSYHIIGPMKMPIL